MSPMSKGQKYWKSLLGHAVAVLNNDESGPFPDSFFAKMVILFTFLVAEIATPKILKHPNIILCLN